MVEKVIILELKENFALAMQEGGGVVRIRLKDGMAVGDTVYILPEDIYYGEKNGKVLPFAATGKTRGTRRMEHFRRLAAMAAVVALICTLLLPQMTERAYAVASFEGKNGVQVQLDKKNRVIEAVSVDGKLTGEELAWTKGRNVADLGDDFVQLLGGGPFLVAYASQDASMDDRQMEQELRNLFGQERLVYFKGDWDDVSDAEASGLPLGRYLMGLLMSAEDTEQLEQIYERYQDMYEDMLDDLEDEAESRPGRVPPGDKALEDMSFDELMALVKQDATWMDDLGFQMALWDRVDDLDETPDELEEDMDDASEDALEDKEDEADDEPDDEEDDDQDE